jgi:AcrR family transcriptional regulator
VHDLSAKVKSTRGVVLSVKGVRTRARIMSVTAKLLKTKAVHEIKVTEIARLADMNQSGFYNYFATVEDVVLVLSEDITLDSLTFYIDQDWDGPTGLDRAIRLVEAAINIWREHRALFDTVGVLADRMIGRFAAIRIQQSRAVFKAFEAKIREAQGRGLIHPNVNPRLAGYECVGLLGAIGSRRTLLLDSGFPPKELVETTARLLLALTTGRGWAG